MGQQQAGGTPKWVWGCGIGCLVLVLIGICLAVFAYFGIQKGMKVASEQTAAALQKEYAALKADNKVPAEQAALYDELVAITALDNASFWTITVVAADVKETFADNQVSEEESKRDAAVRDFFKANPACGLAQFSQFVNEHPEFKDLMQKLKQSAPNRVQ